MSEFEQMMYRYDGDILVGSPIGNFPNNDQALKAAGFVAVSCYVEIEGHMEHQLFRKGNEFVFLVMLDMDAEEVFYADSVPDYLRIVREVINPLLAKSKYLGD